jgi:hypothetical protein
VGEIMKTTYFFNGNIIKIDNKEIAFKKDSVILIDNYEYVMNGCNTFNTFYVGNKESEQYIYLRMNKINQLKKELDELLKKYDANLYGDSYNEGGIEIYINTEEDSICLAENEWGRTITYKPE